MFEPFGVAEVGADEEREHSHPSDLRHISLIHKME
jgi:hypothetical protein